MDLLSVFRTFRRHWLAALPVLAITAACLVYVVVIREPDFETTATVVLISPPAAPVGQDGKPITQTPNGKTDNPLDRFGDQSVVVDIVSRAVSQDSTREDLKAKGADPRYEIGPAMSGPIADITAIAPSAQQATLTAQLVADSFIENLAALQAQQGVDPDYSIKTLPVEPPAEAQPKLSSTMRLAVGVLGLGLVATFFAVSLAEARSVRKRELAEQRQAGDIGSDRPQEPAEEDGWAPDDSVPVATKAPPAPPEQRAS